MTDDLVGRPLWDAAWQRKMRGGTTNDAMLEEAAARIEALEGALEQVAQMLTPPGSVWRGDEPACQSNAVMFIHRTMEAPHAD